LLPFFPKRSQKSAAELIHRADPALSHPIQQIGGPMVATSTTASSASQPTAMGALSTLDQALDQLDGSKRRKS
jgi:hypothetical protein